MCGIAGIISKKKINRDKFENMVDIIQYRGPDDRGVWFGGRAENVAMGHRRLAIIDLSDAAHQPFIYTGRYVLTYNGEIYNYIELRDELKGLGYDIITSSDTEVLAAAYACWGEDCVNHFNGMWAFGIYDIDRDVIFCARDRYGVKPFYYYFDDESFIFGSEIKQILLMKEGRNLINRDRFFDYLFNGNIDTSEETMYDRIYQLLPSESMAFELATHSFVKQKYYDIGEALRQRHKISYMEACNKFHSLFSTSMMRRLRSDAKVGYCLSGGLDSSANVCVAHSLGCNIQQTVTFCSEYKEYDEQEYADAVSQKTGCEMNKVYSNAEDLIDELSDVIWHMDEPFGTTSIYASWSTFKKANECGLKVMIDGQGADEQLAGYSASYSVFFVDLLKHFRFVTFIKEVRAYLNRGLVVATGTLRDQIIYPIIIAMLPESIVRRAKAYIYSHWHSGDYATPFTEEQVRKANASEESVYKNEYRYRLTQFEGLRSLLHYEDRNTMAFSIESRLPFLDYELVEFMGGLPMNYRINRGRTKAIMRDALDGVLPSKVRDRVSKFGFVSPEDKWFNSNMDYFDKEIRKGIMTLSEMGFLDYNKAISWWDERNGHITRGDSIPFRILCASKWIEIFGMESVGE